MNIPDEHVTLVLEALSAYEMSLKEDAYRTISQPNADRLNAKSRELEEIFASIENGDFE